MKKKLQTSKLRSLEIRHELMSSILTGKRNYFHKNFYQLKKDPELFVQLRDELNEMCQKIEAIAVEYKELQKA